MIKQHKSKSLTSNYKKSSFVSKIMVCQSDSCGKVCKMQRYEFPGTLVVGEMVERWTNGDKDRRTIMAPVP